MRADLWEKFYIHASLPPANGVKDMILPAALLLMLIVAQVVLDRVQEDKRSAEMFYVVYSWDVVGDIYDK